MTSILDKFTKSLQTHKIEKLEISLAAEVAKVKFLERTLESACEAVEGHKKELIALHKHMENLAHGLRVLGEALEQLSTMQNDLIPQLNQVQVNQVQIVQNLQQLTDLLVEADVIQRILPEFNRVH